MKRILILVIFIAVVEYYSFVAFKMAISRLNDKLQIALFLLYGLLILGEAFSIYAFRHWGISALSIPWLKYVVNIFFSVLLGKLVIALIMLIGDVWLIVRKAIQFFSQLASNGQHVPSPEGNKIGRSLFISRTAMFLGAALTSGMIYGISNRYNYKIRRMRISLKNLPEEFKGLKIVQLSDIHSGSFDDRAAVLKGIELVNEEKPDIVLFTGDLVNNQAPEIEPYMDVFNQINAPMGVYSVLGNHDYGDYVQWDSEEAKQENLDRLKQHQADMGWRMLLNEHVVLQRGSGKIALVGVENWGAKAHFAKYGDLKKAMQGLEGQDIPVKILMSHDPSHWDAQVRKDFPDIDLTLSGHTHGMQFGIEIPGIKWSPVQYLYQEWAGLYRKGSQYLYVNRGFGFIGYQGRLGILPEITVMELV